MNSHDLISDFPFPPGDRHAQLLQTRLLLKYLADHVYHAELRDATDFRQWLLDLAEACRHSSVEDDQVEGFGNLIESFATESTAAAELRPCRKVTTPPPQARWNGPRWNGDFCPDCGHIHADDSECGFPIGGGRICRCERVVVA